MKLAQYLDSTYLKTAIQANISEEATKENIIKLVEDAIIYNWFSRRNIFFGGKIKRSSKSN